jgi:hypothetical protein
MSAEPKPQAALVSVTHLTVPIIYLTEEEGGYQGVTAGHMQPILRGQKALHDQHRHGSFDCHGIGDTAEHQALPTGQAA